MAIMPRGLAIRPLQQAGGMAESIQSINRSVPTNWYSNMATIATCGMAESITQSINHSLPLGIAIWPLYQAGGMAENIIQSINHSLPFGLAKRPLQHVWQYGNKRVCCTNVANITKRGNGTKEQTIHHSLNILSRLQNGT